MGFLAALRWLHLPGGPGSLDAVPYGLAHCGATGDGPLVKRYCLIFFA